MSKDRHIRAIIVVLYICITIFIDCTGYATGTLTLPSKLKTIEEEAFYGDKSIGSVVLPNTIKKIGDRAFANSSLTEITLPSSITSISDSAFDGCKKVIAYTIENSTAYNFVEAHSNMINRRLLSDTERKNAALYTYSIIDANACSLTGYVGTASKLTIPAYSIEGIKVTKIADKAFEGNTVISSVTIPETVESIDEYAFHNCSSLKSVDMKDGVTSIGRRVFENCTSLVDIHLSNKINHMHEYVFLGCSKLKTLTYPLGMVTKPSDRAWTQGWGYDHASALSKSSVETLIIPDGATAIMKDAFFDATSLKNVYIPASVTSFDQDPGNSGVTHTAFQNITKIITIYGVKGSTSETYAKAKGIAFVDQSATPTVSPTPTIPPTLKPSTVTPKPATATPSPVVYTIKYNANGGSGAPSSQTKTKDVTLTLSSTKPTRSGYTFLGWSTSSIATTATYAAGGTYTKNANATLYAVWEKIPVYTISYNANGGSGAPSSQTKTKDVALVLSSTKPTRSGYTFLGWAASSSATIVSYYPGDTYYTNKNITLYAVWELDHTTFIVKHGSEVIIADGYVEGYFACGEGAGKGATATFTITADDPWTVRATDTSWMTVSTQDGTKAVITIGDVQDGESYSSTLIFTCNGERYDLYVTLDKPGSTPKPATATPKPATATPNPVIDEPEFSASFYNTSKTIVLGERWLIEGSISVTGGSGYLGKVTINAEGVANSYMTQDFTAHSFSSVEFKYWYAIDTTEAPWNIPGTYNIRVWAKDTNEVGGTNELARMTIIIQEDDTIHTANPSSWLQGRFSYLETVLPTGKYWNEVSGATSVTLSGGKANYSTKISNTQCPSHNTTATCGKFPSAIGTTFTQCFGFSEMLGYYLTGIKPYGGGWEMIGAYQVAQSSAVRAEIVNHLIPGDIVCYKYSSTSSSEGHKMMITNVVNDVIYYVAANEGGRCQIARSSMNRSELLNKTVFFVLKYPGDK